MALKLIHIDKRCPYMLQTDHTLATIKFTGFIYRTIYVLPWITSVWVNSGLVRQWLSRVTKKTLFTATSILFYFLYGTWTGTKWMIKTVPDPTFRPYCLRWFSWLRYCDVTQTRIVTSLSPIVFGIFLSWLHAFFAIVKWDYHYLINELISRRFHRRFQATCKKSNFHRYEIVWYEYESMTKVRMSNYILL